MAESFLGLTNGVLQYKAFVQDKELHEKEVEVAKQLHEEELAETRKWSIKGLGMSHKLHQEAMDVTKKIYLWDTSTDLSQHFQQLNTDLISANKESDRDMYDQRSAQFQTIIVSATVMFAALCTVIIEGNLPEGCCNEVIEYMMATFSGISFAFLFLSIVLSIKVILLASHFMYIKAKKHNKILRETIEKTSEVLRLLSKIRMKARRSTTTAALNQMFEAHHDQMQDFVTWREQINEAIFRNEGSYLTVPSDYDYEDGLLGNIDALMEDGAEEEEDVLAPVPSLRYAVTGEIPRPMEPRRPSFQRHATASPRNAGRRLSQAIFGSPEATLHLVSTFEQYWREKCHRFALAGLATFYLGTSFLLASIAVFMYAKFLKNYQNSSAGWITVTFICISCIIGGILILLKGDKLLYCCCSREKRNIGVDNPSSGPYSDYSRVATQHSLQSRSTPIPPQFATPGRVPRNAETEYSIVNNRHGSHAHDQRMLTNSEHAMTTSLPQSSRQDNTDITQIQFPTATATCINNEVNRNLALDSSGYPFEIDLNSRNV